jgi:hypothetical protein
VKNGGIDGNAHQGYWVSGLSNRREIGTILRHAILRHTVPRHDRLATLRMMTRVQCRVKHRVQRFNQRLAQLRARVALCLVVAGACSRAAAPDAARFVAPTGAMADVYRAILDSLAPTAFATAGAASTLATTSAATTGMVVAESTVVFRAPAGVPVTWQDFARVPAGLPAQLEAISATPRASSALPLPRPVIVLTRAESEQIRQAQPKDWWTEFARRYPTQRAVLAFSPIAFSKDSASALVEFVSNCGDNCGGGQLVWMERRPGGGWIVRRTYSLWVN